MSNLKDLRSRITSVKSTKKITSAMKMVAASRLRKAQLATEQSRPFAQVVEDMMATLINIINQEGKEFSHQLYDFGGDYHANSGEKLIVCLTSDRGLCGAFNGYVVKEAISLKQKYLDQGMGCHILPVGKKALPLLNSAINGADAVNLIDDHTILHQQQPHELADQITEVVLQIIAQQPQIKGVDIVYNRFVSSLIQTVEVAPLLPLKYVYADRMQLSDTNNGNGNYSTYTAEPDAEQILKDMLQYALQLAVQKYCLESQASEHAARMTAMDNATRNASDKIKNLTLVYNRTRQAMITKELIEIISGADAVSA
jgi:F-type H+-transporting ATPase subunit gamma